MNPQCHPDRRQLIIILASVVLAVLSALWIRFDEWAGRKQHERLQRVQFANRQRASALAGCTICLCEPPDHPCLTNCGHTICAECINQLINRFSSAFQGIPCPVCRHHVTRLDPVEGLVSLGSHGASISNYNRRFGHRRTMKDLLIDAPEAIRRLTRDESSLRWIASARASLVLFAESATSFAPNSAVPETIFSILGLFDDIVVAGAISTIFPNEWVNGLFRWLGVR